MKLIAQVKLLPTPEQADALRHTLELANAACNYLSKRGWETKILRQYDMHKLAYHDARAKFPLSAQVVVRAIAKVANAYKLDRKTRRTFKPLGSFPYDERILSWRTHREPPTVSIWTVEGRQRMPFVCGEHQRQMLEKRLGQADLVYRNGEWYLHQCCEVETPAPDNPEGWLGVDLGIVNLAVTSDGVVFSGEQVEIKRQWYEKRRVVLQSVGTKSAKRRLKKLSGKQRRFQRDTNHRISRALVKAAQCTSRGIALEDLSGICKRTKVQRGQRSRHHNWAFYQLRQFVSYKSELAGVLVQFVDPRNTSKTCSVCGHCSKSNRPTRDNFKCSVCSYTVPADLNAAVNIAARAVSSGLWSRPRCQRVSSPIATSLEVRDKPRCLRQGS